jgi:hypothetical protein
LTYLLTSTSVFNISCFSIISCPWFFFLLRIRLMFS